MTNELIDFDELQKVLQDLANDVREGYRDTLIRNGRYTTERKLLDSVTTQVKVNDNAYEVTMSLLDYWKYVENDTRPHFPPPSAILRWVQIKPILPSPDSRGRIPSPESLAYLIGRKIARYGTEGSHDLEKTKDAVIPMYRERISQALGHDMTNYIRKVMVSK